MERVEIFCDLDWDSEPTLQERVNEWFVKNKKVKITRVLQTFNDAKNCLVISVFYKK